MSARNPRAKVACAGALLWLLAHVGCAGAAPTPGTGTAPAARVVVATWNIHHARGLDGRVDVARIAAVLRDTGADLIALQEVDVGVQRSDRVDIPAELARHLGMHAAFGKNIDHQGGDYGNAILSRWPIAASDNHHYAMLRAGEQRGLLRAEVRHPHGPIVLLATHVDYRPDDSERIANVAEIRRHAARDAGPCAVVLCGDFNDLPGSRVHAALCEDFVDAWQAAGAGDGATFPAAGPTKRIDWVLVHRAHALRVLAARVPPGDASDHLPLVVELELPAVERAPRR